MFAHMPARFEGFSFSDIDREVLTEALEDVVAAHGLFAQVAARARVRTRRDMLTLERDDTQLQRIKTVYKPIVLPGENGRQHLELESNAVVTIPPEGGYFVSSTFYVETLKIRERRRVVEQIQPPAVISWQFADGTNAQWGFSDAAEALTIVRDPLYTHDTQRYTGFLQRALEAL